MEMTLKDWALVPGRLSVGATLIHHGLAKAGPEGAAQNAGFFEQLGFKPGARWARVAGITEVAAGASAILGLGTRLAALAILATQGVAIAKVHAPKGFDNMAGGWEFNALIVATALGLLAAGPGALSLHEVVERRLQGGPRWFLAPRRRAAGVGLAKLLK